MRLRRLLFVALALLALLTSRADSAPKAIAENTLTTVIGTLHTLATINAPGSYLFKVGTCTLLSGDTLEARILDKIIQAGPLEGYVTEAWSGAQSVDECAQTSIPFTVVYQGQVSLKQTAGSSRQVRWSVVQVDK